MGVRGCFRGCGNIMCDTYIDGIGYICTSCQDEFKEFFEKKYEHNQTKRKTLEELKLFMETEPVKDGNEIIEVDDLFKSDY